MNYIVLGLLLLGLLNRLTYKTDAEAFVGRKESVELKGVLCLLIILHHVALYSNWGVISGLQSWGNYIVAVFFFISGYGLCLSMKNKKDYLKGFISKRIVHRLLPPYLVCIAMYVLYSEIFVNGYSLTAPPNYGTTSLDITDNLLPTSWYVVAIIVFYMVFYVVMKMCKTAKKGLLPLAICSMAYCYGMKAMGFGPHWYLSVFAFNTGMLFVYLEKRLLKLTHEHLVISVSSALVLYILIYKTIPPMFFYGKDYDAYLPYAMMQRAVLPLFIYLIVYLVSDNRLLRWLHISDTLKWLGRYSFDIYLVQGAMCVIMLPYVSNRLFYLITVVASTLFMAMLLHKAVDKCVLRASKESKEF